MYLLNKYKLYYYFHHHHPHHHIAGKHKGLLSCLSIFLKDTSGKGKVLGPRTIAGARSLICRGQRWVLPPPPDTWESSNGRLTHILRAFSPAPTNKPRGAQPLGSNHRLISESSCPGRRWNKKGGNIRLWASGEKFNKETLVTTSGQNKNQNNSNVFSQLKDTSYYFFSTENDDTHAGGREATIQRSPYEQG